MVTSSTGTGIPCSAYLAERGFTLGQILPLLSTTNPRMENIPDEARTWVGEHADCLIEDAYGSSESPQFLVWFASAAGVRRQSVLQAVVAAFRLGVEDMGTREGQTYLGALAMIDLHLVGHGGVAAGDLWSLDLPILPTRLGEASRPGEPWFEAVRALVSLLQGNQWCLTLDGIDKLLSFLPTIRPPEDPSVHPHVSQIAARVIRQHLPWRELVATALWTKVDR